MHAFVGDSLKPEERDLGWEDLGGEFEGKQRQVKAEMRIVGIPLKKRNEKKIVFTFANVSKKDFYPINVVFGRAWRILTVIVSESLADFIFF